MHWDYFYFAAFLNNLLGDIFVQNTRNSHVFVTIYGDIFQGLLVKTVVVNKHFYEIELVE